MREKVFNIVCIKEYTYSMAIATDKIIPITELRRNFGGVTAGLTKYNKIILTKGGRPFAVLVAAKEMRRNVLRAAAGKWKGGALDNDRLWREFSKKKSSRKPMTL